MSTVFGGWTPLFRSIVAGHDLSAIESEAAMGEILRGAATPAQIACFVMGLRMKGESIDEILGLVRGMRAAATPLDLGDLRDSAIDIVGAGGAPSRQAHALNVSTMACFVAAGAGAKVCKHGNRRASSTSGSFDFLDALGIPVEMPPEVVARCVREVGVGFAFARVFHPAMRFAAPVRAEIGIPTFFNILGPLCNPGGVRRGVIGVGDTATGDKMAAVLAAAGAIDMWVVTGDGPIDEIALTGPTLVRRVREGTVERFEITPADAGLAGAAPAALVGGDAARNAAIFDAMLHGERSPMRDMVVLNAAAALVAAGVAADLREGAARAGDALDSGAAARTLDALRASL